jgi:hypothetical protein
MNDSSLVDVARTTADIIPWEWPVAPWRRARNDSGEVVHLDGNDIVNELRKPDEWE